MIEAKTVSAILDIIIIVTLFSIFAFTSMKGMTFRSLLLSMLGSLFVGGVPAIIFRMTSIDNLVAVYIVLIGIELSGHLSVKVLMNTPAFWRVS